MTKEEIKALLQTAEGKEVVQELTGSLQGNRDEILGEKKKLQDSLQTINLKLNTLEAEGEKLRGENFNLTVGQAISKVLVNIGVLPEHNRVVRALLRAEALRVEAKDGKKEVLIGEGDKAKPLEAWAVEWAQGEGKAYITAPLNSGGGAAGSREGGSSGFNLEGATPEQILENLDKISKKGKSI